MDNSGLMGQTGYWKNFPWKPAESSQSPCGVFGSGGRSLFGKEKNTPINISTYQALQFLFEWWK